MNNYTDSLDTSFDNKVKRVNIKEDFPSCDIAVYNLSQEIFYAKALGYNVLKVIHGYGSHGRGGEIKKAVKEYLLNAERKKEIKFFVSGDQWSVFNEKVKYLQDNFPSLIIDEDIKNINSGITVILLQ